MIRLTTLILLLALPAMGKELSDMGLYRRCYSHLVGEVPNSSTDTYVLDIKAKRITGLQACERLLDSIELNPADNGQLTESSSKIIKKALNHLYDVSIGFTKFHRPDGNGNLTNLFEDYGATEDIYDTTSPALVFLENMLNPNRQFKEIFEVNRVPTALRELDSSYAATFSMEKMYGTSATYGTGGNTMEQAANARSTVVQRARSRHGGGQGFKSGGNPVNPDIVPNALMYYVSSTVTSDVDQPNIINVSVGELKGIHYNTPTIIVTGKEGATTRISSYGGIPLEFDMNGTIGKGIPGLRAYIMANQNFASNNSTRPNLEFTNRRLAQSVLRDFMCRELPLLRDSDAGGNISTASNANPFRKAMSCTNCHTTLDPMAGVWRGLGAISLGDRMETKLKAYAFHIHHQPSTLPAEASWWPDSKDVDYFKRPPTGYFNVRTYDGKKLNKPVSDINQLMDELASLDDVYICHARKMFQHFTGIKVPLFDIGDPAQSYFMQSMSKDDWKYWNYVVQLGLNFRKHQKQKELMKEILRSPFYKQSDYGKGQE